MCSSDLDARPEGDLSPWAAQFMRLDSWFDDHPEWRKAMAKPRELKARHVKAMGKAVKGLQKPSKDSRPDAEAGK